MIITKILSISNTKSTFTSNQTQPQCGISCENTDSCYFSNSTINKALTYLEPIKFDKKDIKHLQSLGVVLPFLSGKEAVEFIKKNNVKIKFDNMTSQSAHAQYNFETNTIKINNKYENTTSEAEILAISEAILHEAGHAKDKDGYSSIQEEIDCLSLNTLAHRNIIKKHKEIFSNSNSPIVKDGVCVYEKLFFDKNPLKTPLVNRLKDKYGELNVGDFKHPPTNIAYKVKE